MRNATFFPQWGQLFFKRVDTGSVNGSPRPSVVHCCRNTTSAAPLESNVAERGSVLRPGPFSEESAKWALASRGSPAYVVDGRSPYLVRGDRIAFTRLGIGSSF